MNDKLKILLVEDEVLNARIISMELKEIGLEVSEHVTTGERAIIAARNHHPHVIIMDIRLAGKIDGIDAALSINRENPTPVIFLTGYEDESFRIRAEEAHPLGFLLKPLQVSQFQEIIRSAF